MPLIYRLGHNSGTSDWDPKKHSKARLAGLVGVGMGAKKICLVNKVVLGDGASLGIKERASNLTRCLSYGKSPNLVKMGCKTHILHYPIRDCHINFFT